jgi:hypothetical protein
LDTDNYKDFAPAEHDLDLRNVQTPVGDASASPQGAWKSGKSNSRGMKVREIELKEHGNPGNRTRLELEKHQKSGGRGRSPDFAKASSFAKASAGHIVEARRADRQISRLHENLALFSVTSPQAKRIFSGPRRAGRGVFTHAA